MRGPGKTILAGIHLGGYGRDLTPRLLLPDLLEVCLREIPDLRIRLSSIHPNEVSDRLLAQYGAQPWWPAETPFEVVVGAVLPATRAETVPSEPIVTLRLLAGTVIAGSSR